MIVTRSFIGTHQKLAKIRPTQNVSEGSQCLLQHFSSVCDKKKLGLPMTFFKEPLEVKSCHNRLARPSGSDHQISPLTVNLSLDCQQVKDSPEKDAAADRKKS
jgi:hypothetical protein